MLAAHKHNLYSSLYKSGVLVAWDPAPFSSNLIQVKVGLVCTFKIDCISTHALSFFSFLQWYKQTEYPIFPRYLNYKKRHPKQPFYILHPRFGWQLWQLIQDNTAEPIQKNPPSSGFLGMRNTLTPFLYSILKVVDMVKMRTSSNLFKLFASKKSLGPLFTGWPVGNHTATTIW